MKRTLLTLLAALVLLPALADEGMWLPSLISERIDDMRAKGFRLTAEDIYSINKASMKDAVVLFNGGCTGELISPEGDPNGPRSGGSCQCIRPDWAGPA